MELWLFLGGVVVVLVFLARDRIGGRSRSPSEQHDFESGRPIGYGEFVAPPGTAPGANVNAPYFRTDHSGQDEQSHGPGEGD